MHLASLRPTSTFLAAAFVGCASLLACAPANAGDYQAKRVSADARWLAFIDVEGILKSNFGKFITEHGGELGVEFGEGDMEEIHAELGIDPLKDVHSITVYGAGNPDEDMHMVALLETTAAVDDAVAKLTGAVEAQKADDDDDDDDDENGDISVIELNGQKVHVFSDGDEDTYYVQVRPGPNSASRLVVVSMDRDWMTKGLSVLEGKSPSVGGADKPGINFKPADGTLAFAVCNDLSWIDIDEEDGEPASAILKGAKGVEFAYGESGEDLFFHGRLETGSAEDAQNLSDMVRGLVAMAKYAGSKEPELKPLMEPIRSLELKTEGSGIVMRLKHNTDELIKALSAMAQAANGADDDDDDDDDDDEDVEKVEVKAGVKVGGDKKDKDN